MFSCTLDMEAKARHSFVGEEKKRVVNDSRSKVESVSSWFFLVFDPYWWRGRLGSYRLPGIKKIPAYVGKMTDQNIIQMLREQPEGSFVISQNGEKFNFACHLNNPKTCKDTTSKHEILRSSQNYLVVNEQKRSKFTLFSNRSFCSINEIMREIATYISKTQVFQS